MGWVVENRLAEVVLDRGDRGEDFVGAEFVADGKGHEAQPSLIDQRAGRKITLHSETGPADKSGVVAGSRALSKYAERQFVRPQRPGVNGRETACHRLDLQIRCHGANGTKAHFASSGRTLVNTRGRWMIVWKPVKLPDTPSTDDNVGLTRP